MFTRITTSSCTWFWRIFSICLSNREKRLAKKYYDKLFKEYCITDLSRYKENKVQSLTLNMWNISSCLYFPYSLSWPFSDMIKISIPIFFQKFWEIRNMIFQVAMRWRIEKEVVEGKGKIQWSRDTQIYKSYSPLDYQTSKLLLIKYSVFFIFLHSVQI